jgi:transcriptional regulator with XRE-family HTH domain
MSDLMSAPDLYSGLALLAERLQEDPAYMASVLRAYRRTEGLTVERLIERLGTSANMVSRLAICKRPASDSPKFAAQVREIAEYVNVDAVLLANVIRQVDALTGLAGLPAVEGETATGPRIAPLASGLLSAARDRVDLDESETSQPDDERADEDEE